MSTISSKLNELLEKTYDAEKGYKSAAKNSSDPKLVTFFETKSAERYNFGHQLKSEIKAFGKAPDTGDSITAKAHRNWMDLKAFFASDDTGAMLEEVIRGEKAALEEYNEVLANKALPPTTLEVLIRQRDIIQNGLSVISNLEHVS